MKKTAAFLLAVLTAVALSPSVLALSRGSAMVEDNGYYDERITETTPGSTVYIALTEAKNDAVKYKIASNMVPTSARITSVKTPGFEDGKDYKLISTGSLDIELLEIEDGCEWYFAALKIKDIAMDKYPDDGMEVTGTIKVTRKGGATFTLDLSDSLYAIRYEEAEDKTELAKQVQLYKFKSSTEFELEFPNGKGRFTGKTKGAIETLAAMGHTKITAITKLNKNADMTFFIGNGGEFKNIRDGKLIIEGDNGNYLYKIGANNKLTNMSNSYDEDEGAFVIETNVLGSYVLSDERITSASSGSSSKDDDEDDEDEYVYGGDDEDEPDVYVPVVLINPSTGAAV